jgi:fumarate reductase subunit C
MSRQPYVRPISKTTWYMRHGRYRKYMLREVTCILVGVYCFMLIWGLATLSSGSPERWDAFLASQQNTAMIAFHGFALIFFLIYQTFDWFKLAPKAMPVYLGEKKVPDLFIVIGHYLAWIVVTVFVLWLTGAI